MTTPSRKDRARPAELLAISAFTGLFVGLVVFMSTRDILFAVIGLGIAFIVTVVTIATLTLSMKPNANEQHEIDEQDRPGHG